jgi:hypothetical protein
MMPPAAIEAIEAVVGGNPQPAFAVDPDGGDFVGTKARPREMLGMQEPIRESEPRHAESFAICNPQGAVRA